jgi:hypothetical protein
MLAGNSAFNPNAPDVQWLESFFRDIGSNTTGGTSPQPLPHMQPPQNSGASVNTQH